MRETRFEPENLWGYAKRLRFVRQTIAEAFPARAVYSLRMLDVGCGNGSQLAVPLARGGLQVTGIDTHAPSVEHARRIAKDLPNARFVCGRVEELEAEPFDVMILSEVLEHVTEPRALLSASVKHMSRDGIVIVTVPNGYGEFEVDSWLFRQLRLQKIMDALKSKVSPASNGSGARTSGEEHGAEAAMAATDNHESGHVQFFTRKRLHSIFAECGLEAYSEAAASFISGPVVAYTLARSAKFIEWNAHVSDYLPLALSSGWYFALRRRRDGNASGVGE